MSLENALLAYQSGDLPEARRLVEAALQQDPNSEAAWTLKMMVAEHAFEREAAMQRVLALNPDSEAARNYQMQLQETPAAAEPEVPVPPSDAIPAEAPPVTTYTRPDGVRVEELGTYEMLWDCEFCGTKGLLEKTHRFCPSCGAQQNPDTRYFPSDEEKVLVKDHVYHGVDVICQACQTLNSANAEFCYNCGAPLTDAARAKVIADEVRGEGESFQAGASRDLIKESFDAEQARLGGAAAQPTPKTGIDKKKAGIIGGVVTALTVCVALCLVLVFWTRQNTVIVTGHSWEREIKIEDFQPRSEGDWCDSMPGDAYSVSRSQRQRDTRQVPDGETCTTRRVDNGDGTFSERRECRTKYRSEPIYDDYCDYTVDRWGYARSVFARGESLSDVPAWPQFSLASTSGIGAEREGEREEDYIVNLRNSESDDTYECEFEDEGRWREFAVESRWTVDVGVIGGDIRCGSLAPAN